MREPQGYYIYAYLDEDTPFYIGKGVGDRAWRHLNRAYLRERDTFFYRKLNKMLNKGHQPEVFIIREGLTEKLAYDIESDLILLVGTRARGTGPLCNIHTDCRGGLSGYTLEHGIKTNTAIEVWGELFASAVQVANDPRCGVVVHTLRCRLRAGVPIERAVQKQRLTISRKARGARQVTCWGEIFPSIAAVSRDDRCIVPLSTLHARLREGKSLEDGAKTPRTGLSNCRWCTPVVCWGQTFPSKKALSMDPRCIVTYAQLNGRRNLDWSLERAATTPINEFHTDSVWILPAYRGGRGAIAMKPIDMKPIDMEAMSP